MINWFGISDCAFILGKTLAATQWVSSHAPCSCEVMCLPRSSLELVLLPMNTCYSHLVLLVLVLDMCSFFIHPSSSYVINTLILVSLIYLSTGYWASCRYPPTILSSSSQSCPLLDPNHLSPPSLLLSTPLRSSIVLISTPGSSRWPNYLSIVVSGS